MNQDLQSRDLQSRDLQAQSRDNKAIITSDKTLDTPNLQASNPSQDPQNSPDNNPNHQFTLYTGKKPDVSVGFGDDKKTRELFRKKREKLLKTDEIFVTARSFYNPDERLDSFNNSSKYWSKIMLASELDETDEHKKRLIPKIFPDLGHLKQHVQRLTEKVDKKRNNYRYRDFGAYHNQGRDGPVVNNGGYQPEIPEAVGCPKVPQVSLPENNRGRSNFNAQKHRHKIECEPDAEEILSCILVIMCESKGQFYAVLLDSPETAKIWKDALSYLFMKQNFGIQPKRSTCKNAYELDQNNNRIDKHHKVSPDSNLMNFSTKTSNSSSENSVFINERSNSHILSDISNHFSSHVSTNQASTNQISLNQELSVLKRTLNPVYQVTQVPTRRVQEIDLENKLEHEREKIQMIGERYMKRFPWFVSNNDAFEFLEILKTRPVGDFFIAGFNETASDDWTQRPYQRKMRLCAKHIRKHKELNGFERLDPDVFKIVEGPESTNYCPNQIAFFVLCVRNDKIMSNEKSLSNEYCEFYLIEFNINTEMCHVYNTDILDDNLDVKVNFERYPVDTAQCFDRSNCTRFNAENGVSYTPAEMLSWYRSEENGRSVYSRRCDHVYDGFVPVLMNYPFNPAWYNRALKYGLGDSRLDFINW
jgi:hypothetical protein